MVIGSLEVLFASPPDREHLVGELWLGNQQLAEMNAEIGALQLEIYPRRDVKEWSIALDDLEAALKYARARFAT